MEWYSLFVETGKEEYIKKCFELYFDESELLSLIPKRKLPEKKGGVVHHIVKPLFPGYVILGTDNSFLCKNNHLIKATPHVIRILNSEGNYSRIETVEIDPILKLTKDIDIIDYSNILLENQKVIVKSGPLCGLEGIIKKVDRHKKRVKVLLNFIGEPRLVDLGVEFIQ